MKFDVILSNPPFNAKKDGWKKHANKHSHLLDTGSYYVLLCPAGTDNECIRSISACFHKLKAKHLTTDDGIKYTNVYYHIWKK